MLRNNFEDVEIFTIDTPPGEDLPDDLVSLYRSSLRRDFACLDEAQVESYLESLLEGKLLRERQTRTRQRMVVARLEDVPVASLAFSDVTSGKLDGVVGKVERFVKAHAGRRWRQLGALARRENRFTGDDPRSPLVNLSDILAYKALEGAEELRVSLYPHTHTNELGNVEGDTWLRSRALLWNLREIEEDQEALRVIGKYRSQDFTVTQHHLTSHLPDGELLRGEVVRATILMLDGAKAAVRQLVGFSRE